MHITGVVLAGGYSTRAKTNKLLLNVDDKPLILHTIDSIRNFVDKVIVVTGRYDKELRPYLKDVDIVYNKDFDLGMFSSVKAGIKNVDGDAIILPGDMANISHQTLEAILSNKGCITIPTYNGVKGHPLFINKTMVDLLKKEDINSNLRLFTNKYESKVNLVEVKDPFINFDIDTIKDYENFLMKRKEASYEG